VTADEFQVIFDQIQDAMDYTVRVYLNGTLFNETTSMLNATITGVEPIRNEYFVSVAYNTPSQSEFSMNETSRKFKSHFLAQA